MQNFFKFAILYFFIVNLRAEDSCKNYSLPKGLSVLLSEQEAVNKCYDIPKNDIKFGSSIIIEEADNYCSCMSDDRLGLTRFTEKVALSSKEIGDNVNAVLNLQKAPGSLGQAIARGPHCRPFVKLRVGNLREFVFDSYLMNLEYHRQEWSRFDLWEMILLEL